MNFELKNEQLTVLFHSLGAEASSIKSRDGIEYLWQGDPAYWSGQAPHMFPICGSLRDKTAKTETGAEIRLERHGFARRRDFSLKDQKKDSLTFSLKSSAETKQLYPFDFLLEVNYVLKEKTLITTYLVKNQDKISMPFFIGAHPAFRCPLLPGEAFEDYVIEFEQPELARCPELDLATGLIQLENRMPVLNKEKILPLTHELFSVDTLIFDELKSRSVTCYHPKTGKGIRESFPDFPYFLLWSAANNAPFVAMEPCSGTATCQQESDLFEEKRGVAILAPETSKSFSYQITVL